jgi:hypothetical protein
MVGSWAGSRRTEFLLCHCLTRALCYCDLEGSFTSSRAPWTKLCSKSMLPLARRPQQTHSPVRAGPPGSSITFLLLLLLLLRSRNNHTLPHPVLHLPHQTTPSWPHLSSRDIPYSRQRPGSPPTPHPNPSPKPQPPRQIFPAPSTQSATLSLRLHHDLPMHHLPARLPYLIDALAAKH